MRYVTGEGETLGYLIIVSLLGRGDDGGGNLGVGEIIVVEV